MNGMYILDRVLWHLNLEEPDLENWMDAQAFILKCYDQLWTPEGWQALVLLAPNGTAKGPGSIPEWN